MNIGLLAWWVLVGWCGTVPRPWPWPWPPPPDPDPYPWLKVINVIGGVVGGWTFSQMFPAGDTSIAIVAATTSVGAFVGSILFGDVYGLVRGSQRTGR